MGSDAGENDDLGDPPPDRALIISAHPDDLDFAVAGSIARLVKAGTDVVYCIVTDGDAGEAPEGVPRSDVAKLRRAEQVAAADAIGVTDLHFLGFPDGRVECTVGLRSALARVIRQVRPTIVLCPSHEWRWDQFFANHPDHLAVGQAALFAVYPDARNAYAHPELAEEGLEPHVVEQVWVWGSPAPNHAVDITQTITFKLDALRAHATQTSAMQDLDGLIRRWGEVAAAAAGMEPGRLAEPFFRRRTG